MGLRCARRAVRRFRRTGGDFESGYLRPSRDAMHASFKMERESSNALSRRPRFWVLASFATTSTAKAEVGSRICLAHRFREVCIQRNIWDLKSAWRTSVLLFSHWSCVSKFSNEYPPEPRSRPLTGITSAHIISASAGACRRFTPRVLEPRIVGRDYLFHSRVLYPLCRTILCTRQLRVTCGRLS